MALETQDDKSFVGIKALWLLERWIDSVSFDEFPTIGPSVMAVLRAHVNEIRDLTTMTAWIPHDRLRKHTRLAVSTIKEAIKCLDTAGLMKFHSNRARGIKVYQIALPGITFTDTDAKPKKASQSVTTKTTAPKAVNARLDLEDSFE
jgi:hypothetical protein